MGYRINKGAKSRGKTEAGFMFSRDQVTYIGSRYKGMSYAHNSRNPFQEDYDYDDPFNFDNWMGNH